MCTCAHAAIDVYSTCAHATIDVYSICAHATAVDRQPKMYNRGSAGSRSTVPAGRFSLEKQALLAPEARFHNKNE